MSERVAVDTSVLSLILKGDTRAADYLPHLEGRVGVLSFVTLAELYRWPEERDWGPRRRAELSRFLEPFEVIYSDELLCRTWARLVASLRAAGRTVPFADSWIAATVVHAHLELITHNPRDFAGIPNLVVISEIT